MAQEIKYAKYLKEKDIVEFLEGAKHMSINTHKQSHMTVCKHEIILVGTAFLGKPNTSLANDKGLYKEKPYLCIINDYECNVSVGGNTSMSHARDYTFRRSFAEFLSQRIPDELRAEYMLAYNSHVQAMKQAREAGI